MATKKNKGVVPKVKDQRARIVAIGCGKCIECRKQRAKAWEVRLLEELKQGNRMKFVTLTFDNEHLEKYGITNERPNEGVNLAVRQWLERVRKERGKSVRHWLITELGGLNERIHLHGFIINEEAEDCKKILNKWQNGFTDIGDYCTEASVKYCVKYVYKPSEKNKEYISKIYTSAGIGKSLDLYRNRFKGEDTIETYSGRLGEKIALPIYYRNKIYTEEERELLWLQKLDKGKRYILGSECDEKEYLNLIKNGQEKNEKLGFGGIENWDMEKYTKGLEKLKNIPIFANGD